VSVAHPLRMRGMLLADAVRRRAGSGQTLGFQLPVLPERRLVSHDARRVGQMLHAWSGPGWPDPEAERRYRAAMCIPSVAHSALEYHRWFIRSRLRSDGMRYAHRMRAPVQAPTLQLHGALDSCVLPATARGSGRYVDAPYRWRLMDGVGHFPQEEQPDRFTAELRHWLADPEPER
jgi:pimeloyl-ACP methyl ester carboxylesterase